MSSLSVLSNPSLTPTVREILSRTVRALTEIKAGLADLRMTLCARNVNIPGQTADTETDTFERETLTAIRHGAHERFREIVARHQQEISRRMWRFTRVPTTHEELVQEVFVQAYFSLKNYRGDAPFLHWLQRIATRTGYRYWKQQRETTAQSLDGLSPRNTPATTDQHGPQREAAELLDLLLQRLNPEDRLVITLLHLEEYSIAEIALQTGWSESNVKVRAHRARGKLADWAEEHNHA